MVQTRRHASARRWKNQTVKSSKGCRSNSVCMYKVSDSKYWPMYAFNSKTCVLFWILCCCKYYLVFFLVLSNSFRYSQIFFVQHFHISHPACKHLFLILFWVYPAMMVSLWSIYRYFILSHNFSKLFKEVLAFLIPQCTSCWLLNRYM